MSGTGQQALWVRIAEHGIAGCTSSDVNCWSLVFLVKGAMPSPRIGASDAIAPVGSASSMHDTSCADAVPTFERLWSHLLTAACIRDTVIMGSACPIKALLLLP